MNFAILDADGVVIRVGHCDEEHHELQVRPGERLFKGQVELGQRVDLDSGRVYTVELPPPPPPTVHELRAASYPPITEQLDALWHAMDSGLLPRVPGFYDEIVAVKNAFPKES
jgi:hypothetical protein